MDISALGNAADPFADLDAEGEDDVTKAQETKDAIHLRIQQRNGRKCITTVQGLDQGLDFKKILKAIKKAHW
jgi:translation initiation factor 1